jgi:hypothetical protein
MSGNPYAAPARQAAGSALDDDFVTGRMVSLARESRLWTLVLSVLLFLLAMLSGLAFVLADAAQEATQEGGDDLRVAVLLGRLVAVAINYGLPGLLMFLVSQQLARLVQQPRTQHLLDALRSQRTYWTTMGVLSLLWLVGLIVTVAVWVMHAEREMEWLRSMTE